MTYRYYARAGIYLWLSLHGPRLYVAGDTGLPARFGSLVLDAPRREYSFFVAALDLSPTLGPAGAAAATGQPKPRVAAPLSGAGRSRPCPTQVANHYF